MTMPMDDAPVELPLRGPRWGTLVALTLLATFSVGVYEADRTGRIDAGKIAERTLEPVLGIDGVRRLTDGWLGVPKLEPAPEPPAPADAPPVTRLPSGVCATSPAFDSSGRTLSAEAEHDAAGTDEAR